MNRGSYLSEADVRAVLAFDFKRRTGREYDGRRYGSVTGDKAPKFTGDWTECYGVNPQDVRAGISRARSVRKTLRYNYIVRDGESEAGDVIVLHVAVRLNRYDQPVVKDVNAFFTATGKTRARDLVYRCVAGWVVQWDHADIVGLKSKRGESYFVGKGAWYDCPAPYKYGLGGNFPYHETINLEALKGTRFEYCQYADTGPGKTGLIDWLMMYREEPKVELLAKMGFYALISPMGLKALKDRVVFDWVREHADEVREKSVNYWGPRDIVYAAKHGMTLAEAVKHFAFAREISSRLDSVTYAVIEAWREKTGEYALPARMRVRLDYALLKKRFVRWNIEPCEYVRYLQYAIRSGLDWKNDGTLYPPVAGGRKAFMDRLEALEREANRRRMIRERAERRRRRAEQAEERKRLEALFAERAVEIEAFQNSLARSKVLKGCGYGIVLAKSQEELRAEGKKMHNCVGSGWYGEGIVKGDTLIVMLKDSRGRSYCDIEIERHQWTVKQCYLKRNQRAPDEIQALAAAIAKALRESAARLAKKSRGRKAA